jgi:hypothetical protein
VAGSRKLIALLVAAVVFGVLMAVVKGQDTGVRDALGNTSAPWVVLPFLAGTRYTRIWHAALIGLATTLAAFFGFYLAEAAILDLGAHPWYTDLQLTLGSGRLYEKWGLASGLVYGALGGIWKSRRLVLAPITVGLAFVCEPLIVYLLDRMQIWGGAELLLHYRWMWVGEVLIGVAGIAYVLTAGMTRPLTHP